MKYRLKPRFYVITITTGLLVSGLAVQHIDATCREKIETGQVIKPAVVYAEEIEQEPEPVSLGEFTITHYCSCPICCGVWAENRPLDENGQEYVAQDSGSAIQGNRIYIYCDNHQEAWDKGTFKAEVYMEG